MFSRSQLALLFVTICDAALTSGYLADVEARYVPKPVIDHIFKAPHAKPNSLFALIFLALATVVPAYGVLWALKKRGVKLTSPAKLYDVIFLTALVGSFTLLGMFFLALNLVQTVALSVPIIAIGWLAFPLQI